jgi:hypothetical protein
MMAWISAGVPKLKRRDNPMGRIIIQQYFSGLICSRIIKMNDEVEDLIVG